MTGAKADERHVATTLLAQVPALTGRPLTLIGDKNYIGREFEAELAANHINLLRPARVGEQQRPGSRFFKPLRQTIESINQTLKAQLDLERHGGRTIAGVCARITQRVLALTAAIQPNTRTLCKHRGLLTPVNRPSRRLLLGNSRACVQEAPARNHPE